MSTSISSRGGNDARFDGTLFMGLVNAAVNAREAAASADVMINALSVEPEANPCVARVDHRLRASANLIARLHHPRLAGVQDRADRFEAAYCNRARKRFACVAL